MNKTVITTFLIYTIILIIFGWLYFDTKNDYNNDIDNIKHDYQIKYDSLENKIIGLKSEISKLDTIKYQLNNKIDSIKNNQKDHEIPIYTPFTSLNSDEIPTLFTRYNSTK